MSDFPSLKAWRKALLLLLAFYGMPLVIPIFIFWHFLALSIIVTILKGQLDTFPWAITAGILLATIIGYFLVTITYQFILKLLWDKPPQWLKPPQSLKNKLFHLGVAIGATLPISLINIFYLISIESVEALTQTEVKAICMSQTIWRLSWVWLIAAAYLYQWKHNFRLSKLGLKKETQHEPN